MGCRRSWRRRVKSSCHVHYITPGFCICMTSKLINTTVEYVLTRQERSRAVVVPRLSVLLLLDHCIQSSYSNSSSNSGKLRKCQEPNVRRLWAVASGRSVHVQISLSLSLSHIVTRASISPECQSLGDLIIKIIIIIIIVVPVPAL